MAYYLFQAAYTPEALAALIKKPQNRIEVVTKVVEKLGGRVLGGWFCFGRELFAVVFGPLAVAGVPPPPSARPPADDGAGLRANAALSAPGVFPFEVPCALRAAACAPAEAPVGLGDAGLTAEPDDCRPPPLPLLDGGRVPEPAPEPLDA